MPIPTKNKSYSGMKGKAEVRVLTDSIRVIFAADGDTYQVNKEGWERPSGIYNVTLSKTNDSIKFAAPVGREEPYLVKFLEYANRVGKSETNPGVPEPKIKEGGWRQYNGKTWYEEAKPVAVAKFVVVEKGPYKGLTISYEIPYIFAQYPGTMITMLEGTQGERLKVEKFLQLTGFDMVNDEIPWAGNVLPFLEAKQQVSDKILAIQLNENGFVAKDGLRSIPAYLITPEMLGDDDEDQPKGKATKKAPAKKAGAAKSKAGTK